MLRAMPAILKEFPNFVYIVLGATHPNLLREQGERYRISLERLAKDLGIKPNVSFYNRFVEIDELIEFIGDGGHLHHALPEPGADHLGDAGVRVRLRQGGGLDALLVRRGAAGRRPRGARPVRRLGGPGAARSASCCRDEPRRHAMRKKAYMLGREMIWSHVAHLYMESFQRAQAEPAGLALQAAGGPDPGRAADGPARLAARPPGPHDRLGRDAPARQLTIPNFAEGYCTDDNARALLLTVLLEQLGQSSAQIHRLATTYAAFLNLRLRPGPAAGSATSWASTGDGSRRSARDDSHGRALWALGACVGRSQRRDLQFWASQLFDLALPAICRDDLAPRPGPSACSASATTSSGSAGRGRPARCATP